MHVCVYVEIYDDSILLFFFFSEFYGTFPKGHGGTPAEPPREVLISRRRRRDRLSGPQRLGQEREMDVGDRRKRRQRVAVEELLW